ncbi:MAG: hypothetical protein NZL96_03820 [Patescibacteria group bacterium]|nr:hypothetical protein [Patescibacteria group bacterium]
MFRKKIFFLLFIVYLFSSGRVFGIHYGCGNIEYFLDNPPSYSNNSYSPNTQINVNINRANGYSCYGNWNWVGLLRDDTPPLLPIKLCYNNGQNCNFGYSSTFNVGEPGLHSLRFIVNTDRGNDVCFCNTYNYCVAPYKVSNVNFACSSAGNSVTISWPQSNGAVRYALFLNNTANGWSGNCNSPNPGDQCAEITSTSYTFNIQPGSNYDFWIHPISSCNGLGEATWSSFRCCPTHGQISEASFSCNPIQKTLTINWSPATGASRYALRLDRDPNSWSEDCNRLNPGDQCAETTNTSYTFTDIQPGAYYKFWVSPVNVCNQFGEAKFIDSIRCIWVPFVKLKNASFHTNKNLINLMPPQGTIEPYDGEDNANSRFIITSNLQYDPGIVSAREINLGDGESSRNRWRTTLASNEITFSLESFRSYFIGKDYKRLNNLSELNNNPINKKIILFDSSIQINETNKNYFQNKTLVIFVNGNIDINVNGPFSPPGSNLALISTETISVAPSTTEINSILISRNFQSGSTENQGLKIRGNLVIYNVFNNQRKQLQATNLKPSIFIIFDEKKYLELLPLLTIISYSWSQEN